MKKILLPLVLGAFLLPGLLFANTAPTVVIQSAAMRPGTTLMDVVFRVNDPDDATVKVRALAFVDGVRSFANIIKPVTFAEGTGNMIGDAITTNTDHTITWNAAADWNVQLGQAKFEILAMDGRGLLPLDWITIPATAGKPAVTVSQNAPTNQELLDAFFWLYADGDAGLSLADGKVTGAAAQDVWYLGLELVNGATLHNNAAVYIFKKMNLDQASHAELSYAERATRQSLTNSRWHVANRPYRGFGVVIAVPNFIPPPTGLHGVTAIAAGMFHNLALKADGKVIGWSISPGAHYDVGQSTIPADLSGVVAIAAGYDHSLALKSDGIVAAWGADSAQMTPPPGLGNVTAIAAGGYSLALKSDGTVVQWGWEMPSQVPAGLTGVVAIAAGGVHNMALKSDGTVVAWGLNSEGQATVPADLSGVVAIAAGGCHSLALKSDGTVVAWGLNSEGQATVPADLSGVVAIAAGYDHSLVLKSDGTVVGLGQASQYTFGLNEIGAISGGMNRSLVLKMDSH